MTYNPLDYWGKLAIEQTREIKELKEKIVYMEIRQKHETNNQEDKR